MNKMVVKQVLSVTLLLGASAGLRAAPVEYACVTEPRRDAVLSFTVPGRITAIKYREGKAVKAGTALVQLDNTLEALEVERRQLVMVDTSQVSAAQSQSEMMTEVLASTRSLFESTGSVSREEMNKMELESKTSRAEFDRLQSMEQREEVEYRLALANLERLTLRAPFDGTIVDIMLNEGEICEANQPMVKLVDNSQGFLICNVEEPVGRTLSAGKPLPVSIQAGLGRWNTTGKVVFVAPVVDAASGLMRLKIEFENTGGEVRQGVPGYVTIDAEAARAAQASNNGSVPE